LDAEAAARLSSPNVFALPEWGSGPDLINLEHLLWTVCFAHRSQQMRQSCLCYLPRISLI